jgi:hypothetical protein
MHLDINKTFKEQRIKDLPLQWAAISWLEHEVEFEKSILIIASLYIQSLIMETCL